MKLLLCVVTPDERLRRHFGRGKQGIIPAESLKRGPLADRAPNAICVAWTPVAPFSPRDLERFLLNQARNCDACLLFVDIAWAHFAFDIGNAAYVALFQSDPAIENPRNFFFGLSARLLRNFGQVLAKSKRGDDGKLLSLPLRNFQANELSEIARLCREEGLSGTLSNDVERQLAFLRTRVRPRRKSTYKTTYLVDDASRFFVYGKERHAQFATGNPHLPACELAGLFRFGVRLDERRHYNVSESEGDNTKIEGYFPDCHGAVHPVSDKSHLNIFPNDYF